MTRKKPKPSPSSAQSTTQSAEGGSANTPGKQETLSPAPTPAPATGLKAADGKGGSTSHLKMPPALIICRNKHWKHISCYHGPWLSLPTEILDSLAYSNYCSPRPQPVHPAVVFDLVKIRKLIDEATSLAVRAANGTTSSSLNTSLSPNKGIYYGTDAEILGLNARAGGHTKLSRERRHRMRDHATQKLCRAYYLDEIAASVVMMQSASALEDVAKLVLEREDQNPEAQYVHFFHEKIPSMGIAEYTSLDALDEVINRKPTDSSPYRTRAVTRMFKSDFEGVVRDCTDGLAVHRLYHSQHQNEQQDLILAQDAATLGREFQPKGRVEDKDQPSSIELQLLSLRGAAYLSLACENIGRALHGLGSGGAQQAADGMQSPVVDSGNKEAKLRAEARKLVRTYAKRGLRDYLSYLSHFEYTPGLPLEYTAQFVDKVSAPLLGRRSRGERLLDIDSHTRTGMSQALVKYESIKDRLKSKGRPSIPSPPIYKLNELFAAVPPADVPPYAPERDTEIDPNHPIFSLPDFAEAVTYHPLLIDALHSLLLCHCLIQTSTKELQRHAYMVARVARVSDGYPIFLPPRSPARADWIDVLTRTENWIGLAQPWKTLCTPAHLAEYIQKTEPKNTKETAEEKRLRIKHTAYMQALATEGIIAEEDPSKTDHSAREPSVTYEEEETMRKEYNRTNLTDSESDQHVYDSNGGPSIHLGRWPLEDEYPLGSTERVDAIVRWILEAPPPSASDGTGRSKRKSGAKGKLRKMDSTASNLRETEMTAVEQSVESLELVD